MDTIRQSQGPGSVSEIANRQLYVVQGPGFLFCSVSELAELADISCARVKDTARVIKAKNGTPHTRS